MSRSRRALLVAVLALGVMPLAPANAADFAADCVDGPARTASAAAPHIWDDAADVTFSPHAESADIRAGWVGVRETGFTANIQVTSLASAPINQKFLFSYTGALGEHYVSAQRGATAWIFGSGHLDTTQTPQRQVNDGATTGRVDAASGTITIDLPATAVPADSTDGSAVLMPLIAIKSQFLIGTEASGGLLLLADDATYSCDAIVHEADEQPSTEPTPAP